MKGKNFYKKVFPWLGASFYFFPNKTLDFFNLIETPEEILINAKVDKIEGVDPSKLAFDPIENLSLQNYIQDLNQTEVYLLVTKPIHEKRESNILLLLQNENRLNSVPVLNRRRSQIIQMKRSTPKGANLMGNFNEKIRPFKKLRLNRILKVKKFSTKARFLTTAKSYTTNDLAGYKSICPIFFNKHTAEDFLIKTTKDTLSRSNYRIGLDKGSKDIVKNILNSKIITVGFGDFIHYYSSLSNEKNLNKIEFLFFPNLESVKETKQRGISPISTKSFNFYQNNYYKLKTASIT